MPGLCAIRRNLTTFRKFCYHVSKCGVKYGILNNRGINNLVRHFIIEPIKFDAKSIWDGFWFIRIARIGGNCVPEHQYISRHAESHMTSVCIALSQLVQPHHHSVFPPQGFSRAALSAPLYMRRMVGVVANSA